MSELIDYKIITIYPLCSYLFYKFCTTYYKYILHYNLLVIDMYDNTYDNTYDNNKVDKSTSTDDYHDNILFAFSQIPT